MWRHGDWITITERGSCVITGRSDATLNRGGVRLGTAEFYSVVEGLPEVADSLVVHLEDEDGDPASCSCSSRSATARPSTTTLRDRIAGELRRALSPRHVPDEILAGPGDPAHAVGQEARGAGEAHPRSATPADAAASRGSLADPDRARRVRRAGARWTSTEEDR